jgi:triacylglycerol lipase
MKAGWRDARWPRRGPLSSLSPRRRWYVLAMTTVVLLLGGATLVGVADEFRAPPRADPDVPGTVVLVPGFGGDVSALNSLALRLRAAGRRTVLVPLPDNGLGDLRGQAEAIEDTVAAQIRGGAPSVDLVAYSAGGVATWVWLTDGLHAPSARRVVTLGSPLRGAELAAAGSALLPGTCTPACRQLAPGSALLTRLAEAGAPPGVPWLSIWSRTDDVVTPPDSAQVPGIRDVALQDLCPDPPATHAGLPIDFVVIGTLLYAIDRAPTPPLGREDCLRLRTLGTGRPRLSLN